MRIDAVVADANVLLSAVIGKAASKVFTEHDVEVHATRYNLAEVARYLPRLAGKYRLDVDLLRLNLQTLPLVRHDEAAYAPLFEAARAELATRDPDDAHPLALARRLALPLWSNDRDLRGLDIMCLDTARLLAELEASSVSGP